MNGEKLLRAMSYVDEDLVERAEKTTRRKSPWVRWAALAACLCLALGGWMMVKTVVPTVFSAKSAAPAAQDISGGDNMMAEAITEAARENESGEEAPPQAAAAGTEPAVTTYGVDIGDWFIRMESDSAINATGELPLPAVVRSQRELEGFPIPTEVLERYGEDFFLTQDLLLAAVGGGPEHPEVTDFRYDGEGWLLTVSGTVEGEDAVPWWLLLPIEKDQIQENEKITIKEEKVK